MVCLCVCVCVDRVKSFEINPTHKYSLITRINLLFLHLHCPSYYCSHKIPIKSYFFFSHSFRTPFPFLERKFKFSNVRRKEDKRKIQFVYLKKKKPSNRMHRPDRPGSYESRRSNKLAARRVLFQSHKNAGKIWLEEMGKPDSLDPRESVSENVELGTSDGRAFWSDSFTWQLVWTGMVRPGVATLASFNS